MTALLAALPALLEALPVIFRVIAKIIDLVGKKELKGFLSDVETNIDQLKAAQTPEQKRDVAKSFIGLIGKLG